MPLLSAPVGAISPTFAESVNSPVLYHFFPALSHVTVFVIDSSVIVGFLLSKMKLFVVVSPTLSTSVTSIFTVCASSIVAISTGNVKFEKLDNVPLLGLPTTVFELVCFVTV